MDPSDSLEFGPAGSHEYTVLRRLAAGVGVGALAVGLGFGWQHNQHASDTAAHARPPELPHPAVTRPPAIGNRDQRIVFTKLGSFWHAKGREQPVSAEFSDLTCHRGQVKADVFVEISPRKSFLFENTALPANSFSLDCAITGEINRLTPDMSVGGYEYQYRVTDASIIARQPV